MGVGPSACLGALNRASERHASTPHAGASGGGGGFELQGRDD